MDDFEYSVHISDQDWDCFFQECEDCDLLSPVLASREDSGMSDIDEMGCHFLDRTLAVDTASTEPDPDLQIDGPPDCEGSPVYNYLSKYGIRSPEQVLSGSEEDLHLQTVNLFFEQLKSVTENEQQLEQSHVFNWGSEETGHLEGLIDKQDILSVDTGPSGRNEASLIGKIAKQGVVNTWGDIASEKARKPESANAQEDASKSNTELLIGGKALSTPLITVRMKDKHQGRCGDISKDLKPETKPPDKEKMVTVNRKDMADPIPARQNIAQLDTRNSFDSKDSAVSQIPVSPSNLRRKRRKKKRIGIEPVEPGCEAQIHIHQSESEEERFIQREEMNNLPSNVWKTEHISLQRSKTTQNTDLLQPRNMFDFEASADLKSSKSLPVSFTSNFGTIPLKPEAVHTSFNTMSKSMHDMSLVNKGQLKTEIPPLPRIDKVLNLQESGLNMVKFDPALHLETWTGIRETLSAPLNDNSDAGYQRKSLLSPNISIAADSTEPPSSIVSFKLTKDKDISCLGNETDCSVFKNEQTMTSKRNFVEISDSKESSLSLTEKMDGVETCLDGPETFTCSQDAPQKQKLCIQMNISEYQSNSTPQIIEINMNIPINETDAKTERPMSDNIYHRTDESHIQSRNETSEALIVNASPIKPGNSYESDDKRDISANEVAVSASGEQLFCGKSTRSSEHISGPTQDVSELPHNTLAEMKYTSSAESKSGAKDLESVSLDAADHLPCPVYAISSFWNEMEKLTINDILRIRQIGNTQQTSVLTQLEDGSIADTTDAGDSGYFTQPDDSKPDRLSGDMSYISDLDEDLAQLQTPFSSKQEDESCEIPSSCGVMWENDSDPVVAGDEMVIISSETTLPEHLYTANAQQCFRRMCKNISVQNLQALDAQPIRKILRNASMHSIYSEVDDFIDPFYHVNTSGSKSLSDDEEEVETSGITFSEIIQYLFGEDEPEHCASRADNIAALHLDGTGTSLPEMYDHFFSEFDAGSFVYPIVEESSGDKIVPIFSCSRTANRNLQFPEAYDYFFPDSPDEDEENENTVIKVVTRYDHKSPNHDPVDMYEHFFSEDQSDFLWTNPLSLRRVRRTGFTIPEENTCSGELVPVKTFPKGIIQPINALGPNGSTFPDSLLLNLENSIFQQLAEQQKKCMEMQTVVADPRLDAPFLPLKQADMCLVCIAFASWVLKSTGSGADTWKAALLANVSALSAIRYLRRHKREEVSGKTSLRQIESA
ncbi:PGC-1 and ERR-induced regulator in muscle protein 1 isoform X3 [Ctenopharyngodon idella]|uniref:PGC-1 and ERR-induced regulator in muscle protein 1 isoform X3 n=1 Tax=Ctenopharyngodon idella TaxID=7959 RepID=UPI002231BEAA|nr:PGC-1 and ERR-induced regulator in muscle protein 1 isoform X3 [Ctenopharyngodon idella]